MTVSELIHRLRALDDVPFDAELTNSEFGIPECRSLTRIEHGVPFVVLRFGEAEGMKVSKAIAALEALASEIPFDATVTDARLGDDHRVLQRVYHDPPVTVLDFDEF